MQEVSRGGYFGKVYRKCKVDINVNALCYLLWEVVFIGYGEVSLSVIFYVIVFYGVFVKDIYCDVRFGNFFFV